MRKVRKKESGKVGGKGIDIYEVKHRGERGES